MVAACLDSRLQMEGIAKLLSCTGLISAPFQVSHLSHSTATHFEQALFQLTPLYCDVILWPDAERCLQQQGAAA